MDGLPVSWITPVGTAFWRDCLSLEEYSVLGFFLARGFYIWKPKHSSPCPSQLLTMGFSSPFSFCPPSSFCSFLVLFLLFTLSY